MLRVTIKEVFMQTAGLTEEPEPKVDDFRTKYKANFRTKDGHYVGTGRLCLYNKALLVFCYIHYSTSESVYIGIERRKA